MDICAKSFILMAASLKKETDNNKFSPSLVREEVNGLLAVFCEYYPVNVVVRPSSFSAASFAPHA